MVVRLADVACDRTATPGLRSRVAVADLGFGGDGLILIWGPAGGGKNLLLRLAGLLEVPDRGEVFVDGAPTREASESERAAVRARNCGFVFREPFLLPGLTVAENVAIPLLKTLCLAAEEAAERTVEVLELVGLRTGPHLAVELLDPPAQLAVALARGVAVQPPLVLVENPDALLAGDHLLGFVRLLRRVVAAGRSTVLVTMDHDRLAAAADRVIAVAEGRIVADAVTGPRG